MYRDRRRMGKMIKGSSWPCLLSPLLVVELDDDEGLFLFPLVDNWVNVYLAGASNIVINEAVWV
jgi:hypothetical protein